MYQLFDTLGLCSESNLHPRVCINHRRIFQPRSFSQTPLFEFLEYSRVRHKVPENLTIPRSMIEVNWTPRILRRRM